MKFLAKLEIKNDIVFIPKVCPICNKHNVNNLRPIVDFKYSLLYTLRNLRIRHFLLGIPICQDCLEKEQRALLIVGLPTIILGYIIGFIMSSVLFQIDIFIINTLIPLILSISFLFLIMRYHPSFLSTWFRLYPNIRSKKVDVYIRNDKYLSTFKTVNENYKNWNNDLNNKGTLNKIISSVGMFLKSTPLVYEYLCLDHNIQITPGLPTSEYKKCPKCERTDGILFIISDSLLNLFKK